MSVIAGTGNLFEPVVPEPLPGDNRGLGLLGRLRMIRTFVRNPLEGFSDYQYDRPFDQFNMFGRPTTLLNDPALIRHFFVENAGNLRHGDIRQAILKPALREGLLTSEGELWRAARRAMAPVFTPRNVQGFAQSMRRTAAAFSAGIGTGPASVAPMMSELTYHVLSETLFSGELAAGSREMLADVALFLEALGHPDPFDLISAPAWLPRLTKLRGHSSIRRLRRRVRGLIDSRAARLARGEALPHDFATLLLTARGPDGPAFKAEEIEDHLITFIGAGHETTARGLAWTLYLLANDEGARRRVEAEIGGLDREAIPPHEWIDRLPFTRACFEESMRLYPPAAFIARIAVAPDHCNGVNVPAGSTLMINGWMLHRHRLHWERPDAFDPDRFMAPRREAIDRFVYLPFGLGPRVCIGASFALQEAVILLAELLSRHRFDYAGDRPPWPVMRITIQPDNGMPMKISAR